MLRHVVMFRWSPEATDDGKAAVAAGLGQLPGAIPEIAGYRFGPDAGLAEGNWDFVVVADFADEAAYLVYRDHPVHQGLIAEKIAPIVVARAAVQHEVEG